MWLLSEGVMAQPMEPILPQAQLWSRERGLAALQPLLQPGENAADSENGESWNGWGWKET